MTINHREIYLRSLALQLGVKRESSEIREIESYAATFEDDTTALRCLDGSLERFGSGHKPTKRTAVKTLMERSARSLEDIAIRIELFYEKIEPSEDSKPTVGRETPLSDIRYHGDPFHG